MDHSNTHSTAAPRRSIWLERGLVLALLLGCALAMADNSPPPQLWHHVFTGVELWSNGLNDDAAPTYGAQLLLAQLAIQGESTALLVFKCLLGTGMLALLISRSYRRAISLGATALVVLPVSIALASFWQVSPLLFGCALLFAVCWLFDRAFEDWFDCGSVRWRYLWCLPPLFALGANLHFTFLPGLLLLTIALTSRSVEAVLRWRRHAVRSVASFAALLLLTAAVTLLNPYGWRMLSAAATTAWQEAVANPALIGALDPTHWAFVVLLLLSVVAYTCTQRRCDATQWLLITLAAVVSLLAPAAICFFALVVGLWLPAHLDSALARVLGKRTTTADRDHPAGQVLPSGLATARHRLPFAGQCAATALIVVVVLGLGSALVVRLSSMPVARSEYPLDAMQYVVNRGLANRLAISEDWAPYAAAVVGKQCVTPLSVEGTNLPVEVTLVLLADASGAAHRERLAANDAWILLYDDGVANVYGLVEVYRDRASPRYHPARTMVGLLPTPSAVDWPALPLVLEPSGLAVHSPSGRQP